MTAQSERRRFADSVASSWKDAIIWTHNPVRCMACGVAFSEHEWPNEPDVHEIVRGTAARLACRSNPAGLLLLARKCHEEAMPADGFDRLVWGLLRKRLYDPAHYDPEPIIRLYRPGDGTLEDVLAAIEAAGGK